jgi:phage terminase large subunit-like protein
VLAGNRVGKTEGMGGYETALHLTGQYPDWWEGRRFNRAVNWWAAGTTAVTTRDVVQLALLGAPDEIGTGLIPGDAIIGKPRPKSGVPDAIDTVRVRHVTGGTSRLGFKSYEQGRKNFEGTRKHGIWLDEEPPFDIYGECVLRTMATGPTDVPGIMLCTFTPMQGMSETVLYFLPQGIGEGE